MNIYEYSVRSFLLPQSTWEMALNPLCWYLYGLMLYQNQLVKFLVLQFFWQRFHVHIYSYLQYLEKHVMGSERQLLKKFRY
jgi:hypothetical protein